MKTHNRCEKCGGLFLGQQIESTVDFFCSCKVFPENVKLSLPTFSQIETIITEQWRYYYGTNYSKNSLNNAIDGGKILIEWLMKNK